MKSLIIHTPFFKYVHKQILLYKLLCWLIENIIVKKNNNNVTKAWHCYTSKKMYLFTTGDSPKGYFVPWSINVAHLLLLCFSDLRNHDIFQLIFQQAAVKVSVLFSMRWKQIK